MVDAYALQHPAYIESLKSFAAHLCGLCASMESAGDPRAERAIWSNLRVPVGAVKPVLPQRRGTRTVLQAYQATDALSYRAAADSWLPDVWQAWAEHHALAKQWLEYSMSGRRSHG